MKIRNQKGFTLLETMVALGIFVIVTTIVFVGNDRFNNTIFLTNLAYDVALTVSRAQSYGINVKPFDSAANPFDVGYGVHFRLCGTTTDTKESDDVSFVLFADTNLNKDYANPSEFLERYLIRRGNKIDKLYWLNAVGTVTEIAGGTDITFLRPDPDANFTFFDCNGGTVFLSGVRAVGVQVISPAGLIKNIIIENTGQISVQ